MKYAEMIQNHKIDEFINDAPKNSYQNIRDSSLEAFARIHADGTAGTQAAKIFALLKKHKKGLTYNEIQRLTGLKINAICGRMAELRRIELTNGEILVTSDETRQDQVTGVTNMIWKLNPAYEPGR